MTHTDRAAFAEILGAVYTFYSKDISEAALGIWWTVMEPFDLAAVRKALGQHAVNPDNGQFLPKPADVVRMLGGSTLDSALVAWSKLDSAIQRIGTYATVVFDDPIIHRVVEEMGGWTTLGHCTAKDWPFRQNEFVNRYRGYKMRGETPAYPPKLIGLSEGENAVKGLAHDPRALRMAEPVLIGDPKVAMLVLKNGSDVPRLGITRMAEVGTRMLIDLSEKTHG